MKWTMSALVGVLVGSLAFEAVADEDVYLETSDSKSSSFSSVFSGDHWSDKEPPSDGKSYYVGADKVIVAKAASSESFAGKYLAVAGELYMKMNTGDGMTWGDLRMLDGSVYTWENPSALYGRVSFSGAVSFVAPWRSNNDGRPFLYADFVSGNDAVLTLARTSVGTGKSDWYTNCKWSEFMGTLCLSNGVHFLPMVSPFTLGGTVAVGSGAYLKNNSQNNATITLGGLEMANGSCLQMKMYGSNGISPISITNHLYFGSDVTLAYFNNAPVYGYEAGTPKKLTAFNLSAEAAAAGYDLSGVHVPDLALSLRLGPLPRLRHLVSESNVQTGGETIYIAYEDDPSKLYVMKTENDSADATKSAFVNDNYWNMDLAGVPTAGSVGDLYSARSILFHKSNASAYAFPDLEFTIAPDRPVYLQTESVTFKRWHFTPGSSLSAYTGGYVKDMYGPIETYSYAGSTRIVFRALMYCNVNVHGGIHGSGELKFTCGEGGGQQSTGGFRLYGDNSGFSGDMAFSATHMTNTWDSTAGAWKDTQFPKLETSRYLTVVITNGNALGGVYSGTAAWKSLLVDCYSRISVTDDAVFDEPTRGMAVMWGAQLHVAQGKTFKVGVPLTLAGELRKVGLGTLTLAGEARFIDGNASTEPLAGTNVLYVAGGALKVASTNAVNGMAITFAEGTRLLVDPSPTAEGMSTTGFLATRWAEPLASESPDGAISLEVDGELPAAGITVPICTVSAAAAETLKFKLQRRSKYRESVERLVNPDGTVTFLAGYESTGMSIIFR